MKQISIYDLLSLIQTGYVAMDQNHNWVWFKEKPDIRPGWWTCNKRSVVCADLSRIFNIAPFDSNWENSLIEVK